MYADKFVTSTFERNAVCVTADYSLNDDGTVAVFNSNRVGDVDGPLANVSAVATASDEPGQLTVVFEGSSFGAPYWVVGLGPVVDGYYDWAIVTDNLATGLFVLARDVAKFEEQYDSEVSAELKSMGFTGLLNSPIETVQDGCTYPDSPFTAAAAPASTSSSCPTVEPLPDLNLTEFVRATWYIQQQQLTGYQDEEDLYCVAATYDDQGATVPFFKGTVLSVFNYADKDAVNGEPENTANGTVLCARQKDSSVGGALLVAPCFLPNSLAGDYWILAVGESEAGTGELEWAVISGGQPTEQYDDGCTTKLTGTNGSGLWIFSRSPVADESSITAARKALSELGFTLSQLLDVPQENCEYMDAFIKA